MNEDISQLKQRAAWQAVGFVESGMVVGLGAGSTAIFALRRIAELLRCGKLNDLLGVPCSMHALSMFLICSVVSIFIYAHPDYY